MTQTFEQAVAPKTKQKRICKAKVKVVALATTRVCGEVLPNADAVCPKRTDHIGVMKSGYCGSGWCEGSQPKLWNGKTAPTCKFWMTCPCDCHILLDRMFAQAGMERILVDKSAYHADDGGFKHVTREEIAREKAEQRALSRVADADTGPVLETPAPGIVPAHYRQDFSDTPSGRAARGQLEYQVKLKCDEWLVEKYRYECTPKWLAKEIADEWGINPPSTGAIDAVFKRWVKLGFAEIGSKPTRFLAYTPEGVQKGLDLMKEEARQKDAERRRQLTGPRR